MIEQKLVETQITSLIKIPQAQNSLEQFSETTKDNVINIFDLDINNAAKTYGLQQFLTNTDHGAEHVYNVYKKANEIANEVEETGIKVDRDILYVMIALHDSGRFHMEMPNTTGTPWMLKKDKTRIEKKAKKVDSRHEVYGVALYRFALAKLKEKGKTINPDISEKIMDYVYNHDFMSEQISGKGRFHEPTSIEGQIARLADRISTPAIPELQRYRDTGKRMKTTFFNPDISFEDRKNFSFAKMGEYRKANKVDQFMFFSTLLAVKASDFANPVLQKIYSERSPQKREAAEHIITLAQEEGCNQETINAIKKTLKEYGELYEFDF